VLITPVAVDEVALEASALDELSDDDRLEEDDSLLDERLLRLETALGELAVLPPEEPPPQPLIITIENTQARLHK